MNGFLSETDDFFVNMNLNTQMELPTARDTILHYFEQMKKGYPDLTNFFIRENGDFVLEGDKDRESYRWVALEPKRLCSGQVNPEALDEAFRLHETVLEVAPYLLSISMLDCEALDLIFGFDLTYSGNHDEVVAEALGVASAFDHVLEIPGHRVVNYEPSITVALDENCRLQCRLTLETRTNAFQIRTGDFPEEQLSVYFAVRQYWGGGGQTSFVESFRRQRQIGEDLLINRIIPRVVKPLAQAIASR